MNIQLDLLKWLLIIIILSVLGINVFNYFSQATDAIGKIAGTGIATGISTGLDVTSKTLQTSGKGVEKIGKETGNIISDIGDALDIKVMNKANAKQIPKGDNTGSSIQLPKKSGYCYIGEDKGFRTCMYVGQRDDCMSGDIFPSMEICINPNLRA